MDFFGGRAVGRVRRQQEDGRLRNAECGGDKVVPKHFQPFTNYDLIILGVPKLP